MTANLVSHVLYKIHVREQNTLPPSRFSLIYSILGFMIISIIQGKFLVIYSLLLCKMLQGLK
jgi:hypothetical protein